MTRYEPRRVVKLSDEQVQEVLHLYHVERWTQGALSRKFNVSVGTIGRYVRGESRQDAVAEQMDVVLQNTPAPSEAAMSESLTRLNDLLNRQPEVEEDPLDEILRRRSQTKETPDEARESTGTTDTTTPGCAEQAPPPREPGGT